MRILRSKPVLILGGGAVLRKLMNNAQMRRKKRRGPAKKITGLFLASAVGGAIKYFTDSVSGDRRREKVMRLIGKGEAAEERQSEEWTGADGSSPTPMQMEEPSSSPT